MLLRSHKLASTSEMTINFVNTDGKRSRITLPTTSTIQELHQVIYSRRSERFVAASQDDYQRAINLSHQGIKLTNLASSLNACNITDGSTIRESLKKWTRGINVDQSTLTVTDPIMLTAITERPFLLENCNHTLERTSLTEWITQRLHDDATPNCPCCRTDISDEQIDKLVPNRPAPAARPIAIIFFTGHGMFRALANHAGGDLPARVIFNFFPEGPGLDREEDSDEAAPPRPRQ